MVRTPIFWGDFWALYISQCKSKSGSLSPNLIFTTLSIGTMRPSSRRVYNGLIRSKMFPSVHYTHMLLLRVQYYVSKNVHNSSAQMGLGSNEEKKCNSTFVLQVFKTHGWCKALEIIKGTHENRNKWKKTKKESGISKKPSLRWRKTSTL
jgi:hypothetical protein